MPAWMTSLLREDVPVPMCGSASATITSCPASAASRAIASPTTPAPATSACMSAARRGRDCIPCRDRAGLRHLGVDAAVGMAEVAQQCCRNVEIADAAAGFHVGGGAARDTLDDLRARLRPDCDFLPEKVEFAPGGPAFHIKVAAKPQWIDRMPRHGFDGGERGEVDDRNDLLGDVRKTMARRHQDLRRAAQLVSTELREKSFDGGAAGFRTQITAGDFHAILPDHKHLRRVVKTGVETRKPFVLHQHQEP